MPSLKTPSSSNGKGHWIGGLLSPIVDTDPARTALTDVDVWVGDRVLVTGSLPPKARDIDLLLRDAEAEKVATELLDRGFTNKGHEWVRFVGCEVDIVDLIPADSWDLPESELRTLFSDGIPIEGCALIARPAPHHVLLILARNIALWGGGLTDKRRARLRTAIEEDVHAWESAAARADAWGIAAVLEDLRAHYETGRALPAYAIGPEGPEREPHPRMSLRTRLRSLRKRGRPPMARVIAFSGIDGSGKSTQVLHLERILTTLGLEVEKVHLRLVWATLYHDDAVDTIARPFKAILGAVARLRKIEPPAEGRPLEDPHLAASNPDPARLLRERSKLITRVWSTIVALLYVRTQRRAVRQALLGGKVVICDRYVHDAAVHLRFRYGERTRLRPQIALIRLLLPAPVRAYFIDVTPATALARKTEAYTHAHLQRYVALNRELYPKLGVIRVDGERPTKEICEEIARDVWQSLEP
jgi:thymidylate kinase